MRFLILGLMLLASSAFAANIPVSIKATADNDFIVVLSQGTTHDRVFISNHPNWRNVKETIIQVPDSSLASCTIDFINWNQYEQRGLLATVIGNNGIAIHTGNPIWSSFATGVDYTNFAWASANFPSNTQISQIYASKIPTPTDIHPPTAIWGPPASIGFDPAARWISAYSNKSHRNFQIQSIPCSAVILNQPRPRPVPNPNPRPMPDFGPIDVKGDHFSCYTLEKGTALKPEMIEITDQFGKARAILGMPKMICNPSEKLHGKKRYPIENKERHLVCYEMLEQTPNKDYDLQVRNQFETKKVRSTNRELFCVPSLKKHL